jgi:DNA-binding protein H-NS
MTKLIELQSEILKLQKQADEIRSKEFDKTVADILAKMQAFGITVKDLQGPRTKKSKVGRPAKVKLDKPAGAKKSKIPVAAKYKGPEGQLWSGRGLAPKWMKTLVEAGATKESFLIA